jgi:hypothetical protein
VIDVALAGASRAFAHVTDLNDVPPDRAVDVFNVAPTVVAPRAIFAARVVALGSHGRCGSEGSRCTAARF